MSELTARDLIIRAMQKAGILFKQELPDPDEVNDALDTLNDLLDSYSNDSLFIYARTWETFALTVNVGKYLIGPAQTLNTVRPTLIKAAHTRQPGSNADIPMDVISDESYVNAITVKTTGGIPEFLNYDNAYPYASIRLWPVPAQQLSLFLLTEKPITTFTDLDQQIVLPPGWKRMLITNLATELSGEYGQPINQNLQLTANKAMGNIKRSILKTRSMDTPLRNTNGKRSIYSDIT